MYGIFTYIWLFFYGKYSIHGSYGPEKTQKSRNPVSFFAENPAILEEMPRSLSFRLGVLRGGENLQKTRHQTNTAEEIEEKKGVT